MPAEQETKSDKPKVEEPKDKSAKAESSKTPENEKSDKGSTETGTKTPTNKEAGYNLPDAPVVEQTDKYALDLGGTDSRQPVMQGMGKMVMVILIAVAIALAGIGYIWLSRDDPVSDQASDQSLSLGAVAALIEGSVEARLPGGDWGSLSAGDNLASQSEVRTGADGRAVINIDDGSAIRLDYNSEVRLASLKADLVMVENLDGQVYSRVVPSETRSFEVSVGETDFVSLGTAFRTLNQAGTKGVETFQSTVEVKSDATEVGEGKGYYTENANEETNKVVDLDIEKLKDDDFIEWNKDQDEQNDDYKDKLGFIGDFDGPQLKINNPPDGKVTDNASIDVQGITEPGASVTINGKPVDVQSEGEFDHKVSLSLGKNTITIVAADDSGNKTTKTVKVTRESGSDKEEGSDDSQSITLAGEVDNENGKIILEWSAEGVNAPDGYKMVWAKSPTKPFYPEPNDGSKFVSGDSLVLTGLYDKTYLFRVCIYDADKNDCGLYSNKVSLTAPAVP